STIIKPSTDSSTALLLQNSSGSSFLAADSSKGVITQSTFGPSYLGGADTTGSTNTGTGTNDFVKSYVSGRYNYVISSGNATACSASAGSAIGCELKVFDVTAPASPTYV